MVQSMKVTGLTIESVVMASTYGRMGGSFMGNGRTMTWKALDSIIGVMEEVIKVSITMIRRVDMDNTSGLMAGSMKGGGRRANNMV